jgi:hypothetical protein
MHQDGQIILLLHNKQPNLESKSRIDIIEMTCTYFDASGNAIIRKKYQVDCLLLTQPILQFKIVILCIRIPEKK